MSAIETERLDVVVIGSGLASLNFIEAYLSKKRKIHVISPDFSLDLSKSEERNNHAIKFLPTQMGKSFTKAKNYYFSNKFSIDQNCKLLGSLEFGGLSNYWGLQLDSEISEDISYLKKKTAEDIKKAFFEFLKKNKLIGKITLGKKFKYDNDYEIPYKISFLNKLKKSNYYLNKPILAFIHKKKKIKKKISLSDINEKENKLTSSVFFKRYLKNKDIKFHNCYVEKIFKNKNKINILCKDKNNYTKNFLANKVIFGSGTVATTKIIMEFLNINNEVKIKHHPRLISVFFSKEKIKSPLTFTPSLFQIKSRSKKNSFSADFRPGNKLITNSIIELNWLLYPLKFIINLVKDRLIFSNVLLDSSFSNLYIRKDNKRKIFKVYSREKPTLEILKEKQLKIFKFLLSQNKIFPIFRNFFPGVGADYHYFGTIPMECKKAKNKLSVNQECQLRNNKNIYIVDGSVIDFKKNKYPLGVIIANARRIGKKLSK